MKKRMAKRALSVILAVIMTLSCLSACMSIIALAADGWTYIAGSTQRVERSLYVKQDQFYTSGLIGGSGKIIDGNAASKAVTVGASGGSTTLYTTATGTDTWWAWTEYIVGDEEIDACVLTKTGNGGLYNETTKKYIGRSDSSLTASTTETKWTFGTNKIYNGSYYMTASGSNIALSTSSSSTISAYNYAQKVYVEETTAGGYYRQSGPTTYNVEQGSSLTASEVESKVEVQYKTSSSATTYTTLKVGQNDITLTWNKTLDTSVPDTYTATVKLGSTVLDTITVTVSKEEVPATTYIQYTPQTSGQILEEGTYVFWNEGYTCLLLGESKSGGGLNIAFDDSFSISSNELSTSLINAPIKVTVANASNNTYYFQTADGKYISVGTDTTLSGATLTTSPTALQVITSNGKIAIGRVNSDRYLNCYHDSKAIGVWYNGLNDVNNRFVLYKNEETYDPSYDDGLSKFPEDGSVKISKSATGEYLKQTGVGEVQLSNIGIPPFWAAGVDVMFITDVSNSMAWVADTQRAPQSGETSKLQDMQAAVSNFCDILLANNDGPDYATDNTVTFTTFGGWDADISGYDSTYTDPTRVLFVGENNIDTIKSKVNNITFTMPESNTYYLTFDGRTSTSAGDQNYGGTCYDAGLMQGYNTIAQIKQNYKNKTGVDYDASGRKIYVIFVTDGAPTAYNGNTYKSKQSGVFANMKYTNPNTGSSSSYTGSDYSQDQWYSFISSNPSAWATKIFNDGSVADFNCIGIDFEHGGFLANNNYWIFTDESNWPLSNVLKGIVSGTQTDLLVSSDQEMLATNLAQYADEAKSLTENAYTVDEMGSEYDLQTASTVTDANGNVINLADYGITPNITYTIYPSYHKDQVGKTVNGVRVTTDMIGEHYGTPEVVERVTFSADGTKAYSNLLGNENIMSSNGVITAQNFIYNGSDKAITVRYAFKDVTIAPETFLWNEGSLSQNEKELSYTVYLTGSMEGERAGGDYDTNEQAKLYYKDYQGIDRKKIYPVPNLHWDEAKYSYELYLVNTDGDPIDMDGYVVSFEDRTVMSELQEVITYLNTVNEINMEDLEKLLPDGYKFYNNENEFEVFISSSDRDEADVTDASGTTVIYEPDDVTVDANGHATTDTTFNDTKISFAIVKPDMPKPPMQVEIDYELYLVDRDGNPIDEYGEKVSLEDRTVMSELVQVALPLHSSVTVDLDELEALLPDGYFIYNTNTSYSETYNGVDKEGTGASVKDNTNTTFVTYPETAEIGKDGTVTGISDISRVQVDFAIAKIEILPDVIVVDYGKTILCSPLDNDAGAITLLGVGGMDSDKYGSTYTSQNGVFRVEGNNVTFSPFSYMSSINRTAYYVTVRKNATETEVLSSTIFVIPATTVYYEDDFGGSAENGGLYIEYTGDWYNVTDDGEKTAELAANTDLSDRQDRGEVGDGHVPYGYDSSYSECTQFSNGSATMVEGTVDLVTKEYNAYAEFYFTGTGFDIISRTDLDCGMISVYITDEDGEFVSNVPVINKGVENLYQIPVISYTGLPYGTYKVRINVNAPMGVLGITGSTFYLDAIRIYDPMGLSGRDNWEFDEANAAYSTDKEANAYVASIRDYILSIEQLGVDEETGAVYVDTIDNEYTSGGVLKQDAIEDFHITGPNEEVYLTPGKGIGFALICSDIPESVQLEIKIPAPLRNSASLRAQTNGVGSSAKEITVQSATEMFYDITDAVHFEKVTLPEGNYYRAVVVLTNGLINASESEIVSITNVKMTYNNKVMNIVETKDGNQIASLAESTTVIDGDGNVVEQPTQVAVGFMASWDIYCDVFDTIYTQHQATIPTYDVAVSKNFDKVSYGEKSTAVFTSSQFVNDLIVTDENGNKVNAYITSDVDEDNLYTASYGSAKTWTVTVAASEGEHTYTVKAANGEGSAADANVEVEASKIVSLKVLSAPSKTKYNYGDTIDTTGLVLEATYSDGTVKQIKSGYTLNDYKADHAGNRTIKVYYNGAEASFKINVKVTFVQIIMTIFGFGWLWKK